MYHARADAEFKLQHLEFIGIDREDLHHTKCHVKKNKNLLSCLFNVIDDMFALLSSNLK